MFEHGFPPYWSTIKKLIWLVGTGIVGGVTEIWKTVTGAFIHITNALAAPMRKCEVTLEPIQDLHGQDAPYPAGGGKNKFNQDYFSVYSNYNQNYSGYSYTQSLLLKPNTQYTFKANSTSPIGTAMYFYIRVIDGSDSDAMGSADTGVYPVYNGNLVGAGVGNSFVTGETGAIRFGFPQNMTYLDSIMSVLWQLEEGATATPWSPFANICPITGWTGCEVQSGGVNLLTPFENGFSYVYIPKDTQIIASSDNGGTLEYFAKDKTRIDYWTLQRAGSVGRFSRGFKLKADAYYWRFTDNTDNVQLEIGTTMHDYVAPTGTTASVTFHDTVYGGKYDFVSGVGESNKQKIVPTNYTIVTERVNGYYCRLVCQNFIVDSNSEYMANIAKIGTYYPEDSIGELRIAPPGTVGSSQTFFHCWIPDTLIDYDPQGSTSLVDCIKRDLPLANWEISAPLPTPVPISLTPQPISTLAGENNVWGDGTIELTYKAQAS